jgi:thioredoxin reductase
MRRESVSLNPIEIEHRSEQRRLVWAAHTEAATVVGGRVFIVGGGNSAGQAALFFANYASTVTMLVRGQI